MPSWTDEEKGEAYCYVFDGKGMTVVDHTVDCKASNQTRCTLGELNGCAFRQEVLKGEVKIVLPEAA